MLAALAEHGLTLAHLASLRPAAGRFLARERIEEFCARMDPMYQRAAHSRLLCEHLEALERRDIEALIVEEPPRHSKSYHVSERFPAWYLGRNPAHQVILASYGAELAMGLARKARSLLGEGTYPFDVRVAKGAAAVNRWHTTLGGTMLAAGVGGAMTGFGAHLLLIDDPVKDRKQADSGLYRETAWSWYQEVARTRLMPRGVQTVTMTRWHEDDLVGRILNSAGASKWTVLRLPAVAEDPAEFPDDWRHLRLPHLRDLADPLGREPGTALWPAWIPLDRYPSVEAGEISQRAWLALYQQRPTTPEGRVIKRAWFSRRYDPSVLPRFAHVIQVVDSAFKDGVANDWSVIATWATDAVDFYLLDIWRARVEFPDLIQAIKDQYAKWRPRDGVFIEDKASGQSAIQTLRRTTKIPVVPFPDPHSREEKELAGLSKESRADAATPFMAAGKVLLPEDAPWVAGWIEEHVSFPGVAHDDQVDTSTMALAKLGLAGARRKTMVSM